MSKFGGFTEQQKEVLARRMGFSGPMNQFQNFLTSDPAKANQFASYESKAQQMVASAKDKRGFDRGGLVDVSRPQSATQPTSNTTPTTPATPNNSPVTVSAIQTTTKDAKGKTVNVNAPFVAPNLNSEGSQTTQNMMDNPQQFMTPVKTDEMTVSQNELVDSQSGQVAANADVQGVGAAPTAKADAVTTTPAPQVSTATTSPQVAAATDNMQAAKGTVGANSLAVAAQALPSADATVQGQLAKLMTQFEGGETPAWAAGAIRNANAIMAQRGLGSSSMAGSAVTQAAMESAISIAAQDASTFSAFEMQNLNNRQQARLQNAQAFLQTDLANLDNEQQMAMFKSQAIIQSLFTDQAAENASRQFNATSQGQTDQFFAGLKTQVSQFNAAQSNAMEQFNVDQENSLRTFNRQMADARDQFNASNRLIVDQSNAQWRRSVTTTNNATINEANRIDAQTATGMTLAAYNNMMQKERDFYTFAYTAFENSQQRAADLVLAKMNSNSASSAAKGQALGALAGSLLNGIFS